jgi:hypothetical protein
MCSVTPLRRSCATFNNGDMISRPARSYTRTFHCSDHCSDEETEPVHDKEKEITWRTGSEFFPWLTSEVEHSLDSSRLADFEVHRIHRRSFFAFESGAEYHRNPPQL